MKRRPYNSVKLQKKAFDICAEEFTAKYAILVGIERLSGYVDNKGDFFPPAYSLHVDGLCFRVESVTHAICFLRGVVAGFEFSANRGGVGFVTRLEMNDAIEAAFKAFVERSGGDK